jgi:hypothetical protein
VDQRLLRVRGGRFLPHGGPVHGQPLVQGGLAAARAPLVGAHPPCRRVQPHSRGVPLGQLIQTAPGGQEHFSRRILRVARRPSPPAAVRDDVRAVRREQGIEALPCLALAFPQCGLLLQERLREPRALPHPCPALARSFDPPPMASQRRWPSGLDAPARRRAGRVTVIGGR